ncbi:MAG: hypothetical protein GF317_16155 [Candidatus Lokiarchaeota archaeon]|nr:hypothetical protein [Candidatus Lokiarchaeota archaeon]MBD3201068.1 hypothetical protein [Candidatus Lokiarchaeota archaeon]
MQIKKKKSNEKDQGKNKSNKHNKQKIFTIAFYSCFIISLLLFLNLMLIIIPLNYYLNLLIVVGLGFMSASFMYLSRGKNEKGCIYREINLLKGAAKDLEKKYKMNLNELAAEAYGEKLQEIVEIYEKILELTPKDSSAAWHLASAHFFSENFEKSAQLYCEYRKKFQNDLRDHKMKKPLD